MTNTIVKGQFPYGVSQVKYSEKAMENLQAQRSKILEYAWIMKKAGRSDVTIKTRKYMLEHLAKLGAKLLDSSSVETVLATETFTLCGKLGHVKAYAAFAKTFKIEWTMPTVNYQQPQPFVPLESEVDQLIEAMTKTGKVFLQIAKDTGARAGEIIKIKWVDIDVVSHTIAINTPMKGSNSRTIKVTEKTIAMISTLKKNHGDFLFNPNRISLRSTFTKRREKLARELNNPRILRIHFHTLRHFRATTDYARTLDILRVQQKLGHKGIDSSMIYTHLIEFSNAEYDVQRPKSSEEEDDLIEQGYQFVRFDEREKSPIYRRRK